MGQIPVSLFAGAGYGSFFVDSVCSARIGAGEAVEPFIFGRRIPFSNFPQPNRASSRVRTVHDNLASSSFPELSTCLIRRSEIDYGILRILREGQLQHAQEAHSAGRADA